MREEHLHIPDITSIREGAFLRTEHATVARHLLKCRDCRDLLPVPRKEEFLDCLFGDDLQNNKTSRLLSIKGFLAASIPGQPAIRNTVIASLMFFTVLGFSFLLLMQRSSPVDDNLVAAVSDNTVSNVLLYPPKLTEPDHPENKDSKNSKDETVRAIDSKNGNPEAVEKTVRRTDPKETRKTTGHLLTRPEHRQSVETRGASLPCGGRRSVDLEARQTDKGLVLSWNKLPYVISYSVYLSDLDERLVDQHETADKTSYFVTVPLDTKTVYRWKLIATLKNGERIVSESQNFKIGDSGPITARKSTSAAVRCMENKQ